MKHNNFYNVVMLVLALILLITYANKPSPKPSVVDSKEFKEYSKKSSELSDLIIKLYETPHEPRGEYLRLLREAEKMHKEADSLQKLIPYSFKE